jgi:hypothetical protein
VQEPSRALLTFGQLSLWRAIEQWPADRMRHANSGYTWDLPDDCTVESVRRSLNALNARHDGLRTSYACRRNDVEQVTWKPSDVAVATAELGGNARNRAGGITAELVRRPFHLERDRPWRGVVVTDRGRPVSLALAFHHIAVDAWATDLLHEELLDLLARRPLATPGPTCRAIAEEQRSAGWARRRESAIAHWQDVLAGADLSPGSAVAGTAPGSGGPVASVVIRSARLHAPTVASAARVLAARLQVTMHGVMLAAFCRSLADRTGQHTFVVMLMSGNRGIPGWRSVVSSFNQLTPVLIQLDPAEDFRTFASRVNLNATVAYWNGCYDPDLRAKVGADYGRIGSTLGFPYVFNFVGDRTMPVPDGAASDQHHEPSEIIESSTPGTGIGYPLYFVAGGEGHVDYCLHEITTAVGGAATRAQLQSFSKIILDQFDATCPELPGSPS